MMKRLLSLVACAAIGFSAQAQRMNIIPRPASMAGNAGEFVIKPSTVVYASPDFQDVAALFSEQTGIAVRAGLKKENAVSIVKSSALKNAEAYHLFIGKDRVEIRASGKAGALYGMQSLLQLIGTSQDGRTLPAGSINDEPRFAYRGMHLDVSRNFYPVTFVKKFIDLMALYKMNTFHWHLTDGAGWRLEIKKYPGLTERAAWRTHAAWTDWQVNGRRYLQAGDPNAYGGYYTQEEAREIVAYAARRGITVIPEIEMPGHSEEVLAVYPHLSCSGQPYKNSEFCLGNDSTFTFLEDVLDEVRAIFPSKYIHIGGDEADKKAWKNCPKCQRRILTEKLKNEEELQSYAVRRMERYLVKHGRKLLGWDEILEGGLAPEATVMSWRGEKGGITAATEGHDVVMTPGGYCYFDSYQADPATEPQAIGGFLPLSKVYSYEPVPAELDAAKAKHILGAQANLWTEYMPTTYQVEYMAFPRMLALSEVLWSPANARDWDGFKERLQKHYGLLQKKQVNYYRPSYQLQIKTRIDQQQKITTVFFDTEQYQPVIRYTLDGSVPTTASALYNGPFEIKGSAKVTAAVFRDTLLMGRPAVLPVDYHIAIGKKVTYNEPYNKGYQAQKDSTLTNGYRGSLTYGDGQWQGFLGKGLDVTIDLGNVSQLNSLSVGFMQLTGPGVYMPPYVEVSLSVDGKTFTALPQLQNDIPPTHNKLIFKDFIFSLKGKEARYIRVKAPTQKGFIFTDEIIVY